MFLLLVQSVKCLLLLRLLSSRAGYTLISLSLVLADIIHSLQNIINWASCCQNIMFACILCNINIKTSHYFHVQNMWWHQNITLFACANWMFACILCNINIKISHYLHVQNIFTISTSMQQWSWYAEEFCYWRCAILCRVNGDQPCQSAV